MTCSQVNAEGREPGDGPGPEPENQFCSVDGALAKPTDSRAYGFGDYTSGGRGRGRGDHNTLDVVRHSLGPDLDLMRGITKVGRNILRGILDNVTGMSHVADEIVCRARYLVGPALTTRGGWVDRSTGQPLLREIVSPRRQP